MDPSCPFLIMGMELVAPELSEASTYHFSRDAQYLIRRCDGESQIRTIIDPGLHPQPPLVSTRAVVLSPFPSDQPGTIYAAGFDANGKLYHNTAWIYKGIPVRK